MIQIIGFTIFLLSVHVKYKLMKSEYYKIILLNTKYRIAMYVIKYLIMVLAFSLMYLEFNLWFASTFILIDIAYNESKAIELEHKK